MYKHITTLLLLCAAMTSCRNVDYITEDAYDNDVEIFDAETDTIDLTKFPNWTTETHSNAVDPDMEEVFFEGQEVGVKRIDLTISSSNWSSMWSDLSSNLSRNTMGGDSDLDFTPIWVPCTVEYDGREWYQVGVRFKGNSSLQQTYSSGSTKLSMKLDFDQYEDSSGLKNQRFYGFKQLNLNNNYEDLSFMREKVVSDLLREFSIPAAHTSFCELYVNDSYHGLYTIVEEVDDTVIKTQYSSGGNCYKPEDDAGSFKSGTYDTDEFYLKTNTSTPNYSDVRALYDALHSSSRTSNETSWKSDLESTFDVDHFLKWLAANTAIQNWDVYGNKAHNYYLYNNPDTNKLTWIPWDHNEALQSATGNYITFDPDEYSNSRYTGTSWPLLYYLMQVDDYEDIFYDYLEDFINNYFEPTKMQALYEDYESLIQSYAYAETKSNSFLSSNAQFNSAVSTLQSHVSTRYSYISKYLD
ncbi:MAG: CotH kinase family protein [Rikenellaceae bacterium]